MGNYNEIILTICRSTGSVQKKKIYITKLNIILFLYGKIGNGNEIFDTDIRYKNTKQLCKLYSIHQ